MSNENKAKTDLPKEDIVTIEEVATSIMSKFEERINRPTKEQTHIRRSFLINRELDRQINELARKQPRGWKTHFINEALEILVKSYRGHLKDDNA
ncbi:hypothetical protein COM81_27795 [Priestia megaterium]|uniref:hypothetical protein n=1 Tax=Priestia megaterium TaxID=1404 RepID=UPI000BEB56B9|nr:hypothetical protein [Priestia megaterium]PEE73595.1 hypothetical protein COM81_27795 [Priestia megaterium]